MVSSISSFKFLPSSRKACSDCRVIVNPRRNRVFKSIFYPSGLCGESTKGESIFCSGVLFLCESKKLFTRDSPIRRMFKLFTKLFKEIFKGGITTLILLSDRCCPLLCSSCQQIAYKSHSTGISGI